jgi:hypothetical protein
VEILIRDNGPGVPQGNRRKSSDIYEHERDRDQAWFDISYDTPAYGESIHLDDGKPGLVFGS